jgi:hypothetical protein
VSKYKMIEEILGLRIVNPSLMPSSWNMNQDFVPAVVLEKILSEGVEVYLPDPSGNSSSILKDQYDTHTGLTINIKLIQKDTHESLLRELREKLDDADIIEFHGKRPNLATLSNLRARIKQLLDK